MSIIISFLTSFIIAGLLVKYKNTHHKFSSDDLEGVQKFHTESTPRIGGVAIFSGVLLGFLSYYDIQISFMLASLLPVFLVGLLEDLTKKISPSVRLLVAFVSAGIAIYGLDIALTRINWLWFDNHILSTPIAAIVLSVFMIGGISHASNIIDGFNGLLLGYAVLALSVFLWVSLQVNDVMVSRVILTLLGAILGLILFNFPTAKIFTGDGGAYLIGFLLAVIALLLVKNNPKISPWFPLLVMIYPAFETVFSMYRRKILKGVSTNLPDASHLHTLIYKRVSKYKFLWLSRKINKNATTAVLIWLLVFPFMLPALFWWDNSLIMIGSIVAFCILHVRLYFKIVRFKIS